MCARARAQRRAWSRKNAGRRVCVFLGPWKKEFPNGSNKNPLAVRAQREYIENLPCSGAHCTSTFVCVRVHVHEEVVCRISTEAVLSSRYLAVIYM